VHVVARGEQDLGPDPASAAEVDDDPVADALLGEGEQQPGRRAAREVAEARVVHVRESPR
jgi:hypothetical protein